MPIDIITYSKLKYKADLVGGKVPTSQLSISLDNVADGVTRKLSDYASIASGALVLPSYVTEARPAVSTAGSIIFDSTLGYCILWNGTAWVKLDGTSL